MTGSNQDRPKQQAVPSGLRRAKQRVPAPVKSVARHGARGFGTLTAASRTDPDFLIIGTKRGGTTSLWNSLLSHPDCLPLFPKSQEIKSPHYFDINYGRGRDWYRSHFPTRRQRDRHERRTGRLPISGESSPYYMFHPMACARIARDLPNVKIIVSLRDPVERIWSHYNERFGSETEDLGFEDALAAEDSRLAGEVDRILVGAPDYYSRHHDLSSYLARGRYPDQLRPCLDAFAPDRLLVLRAEDYYTDEMGELQRIADFLGIAPFPEQTAPRRYNHLPRAEMSPSTRTWLTDYYRDDVASLEAALGRSFDWPNFRTEPGDG